ncbi:hypothetical protein SAMN04488103_102430 [Gemmobacter aquatilis]|uniref:Uncharacterized protein n=2 Tax=Gemmobacter aquatilis TaxID=933059 RepID=A0A1H8C8D0_9RHOB|nr:hypothetical protein SAMN04488103_102430 [Gemmobacter aquatilis]
MPLTISRRKLAPAWGDCNAITVSRRLAGVPTIHTSTNEHIYLLAAVLPRVKKPEHIAPLFAAATDDSSLYVGSGAVNYALAELLDRWLAPEMRARYQRVRAGMVAGIAGARGGAAYLPHIELIQLKALHHSEILRHVVLGAPLMVDFSAFAPAFALVNGQFESSEFAGAA